MQGARYPEAMEARPHGTHLSPPPPSQPGLRCRRPPLIHHLAVWRLFGEAMVRIRWRKPSPSGIMALEDSFFRILPYLDKVRGTISCSTDTHLFTFTLLYMTWIVCHL